ncbi:T9SS type A sorting domain-containing protein [Dyadobacter soli]|nr:T9SS type A sorting domain-containing protein [Dyadobacter soli]
MKVPGETSSYAVYPNPASGKFTFSAADANISSLKMFSITGYPVGIRAKQAGADNSWDIETKTTVAPGLYYIQFTTGQGAQETLRMIIR